ncbi:MAG TPA: helix-hairpin-helix domain-containing protein [Cyclobacteriaceae bacterium]
MSSNSIRLSMLYNRLKLLVRNYFGFSNSEINGTFILTALILLFVSLPILSNYILKNISDDGNILKNHKAELLAWKKEVEGNLVKSAQKKYNKSQDIASIKSFPFDPNDANSQVLGKLGFSERAIENLLKYRTSGGILLIKSDLERIYGISNELITHHWDNIQLPDKQEHRPINPKKAVSKAIKKFRFDPNTVSKDELIRLGFKAFVIERLVKYRDAGGNFSTREDLKKIYGISHELIELHWDSINISSEYSSTYKPDTTKFNAENTMPDLNFATTDKLKKIKGIGDSFSNRIVKYRDMLGGYHSFDQLKEVYNLQEELIERIKLRFKLESPELKLIKINVDSLKLLSKHPYISWSMARSVVNYRKLHGPFTMKEELLNIKIIDDSTLHKLKPYLDLSNR